MMTSAPTAISTIDSAVVPHRAGLDEEQHFGRFYREIATAVANAAIVCASTASVCRTDVPDVRSPFAGTTTVAPGRGSGSSVMNHNKCDRLSILPFG